MEPKTKIHIKLPTEFSSRVKIGGETYDVQTEDLGRKSCKLVTRIYLKGRIVFTKESTYTHLLKLRFFDTALKDAMEKQHQSAVDEFTSEMHHGLKSRNEYFDEAKKLLKKGAGRSALELIKEGLERYPGDPFLLSYYGCLLAVVGKKPQEGVKVCREAIKALGESMPFGSEFFHPIFYLNLGRASLAAGEKQEALKAFNKGLKTDPENSELLWEIRKLGKRRTPPVPFLKRNNPINKYIGMLLSKTVGDGK